MDNAAFQHSHSSLIYNDSTRESSLGTQLVRLCTLLQRVDLGDEVVVEGHVAFGLAVNQHFTLCRFASWFVQHFEKGTNSRHF